MEADPLIGLRVFGGYVVTKPIGAGGMGQVYLVENQDLHKKLVIKVLLPERTSSQELVERFLAEARAASAIRHRHIVEILDSSTLPDGRPYILMEHLEGETLFAFAGVRMPLSIDVTLAILCQICSGLEAAHKRGVVHRDIKPSNIFITPQPDNRYFTKILDFGIAKLEDPQLAGGVMTKSVMVAGTPHYMSPEQARTLRDVDHRTDIYAVGVIAYELLTGQVPYTAHSIGELVFQQTRTTPKTAQELRPELPESWSAVLEQAMAIDPRDRPASARELAMLMTAATPEGTRIAKEVAPLLFARGDRAASVVGVRLEDVEAQVSEVRSDAPQPRRIAPTAPPRSPVGRPASSTGRPESSSERRTELLAGGDAPAVIVADRDRVRTPPRPFLPRPSFDQEQTVPPARGSVPPGQGGEPPAQGSEPPTAAKPASTVVGEDRTRSRNLRWLLIGLVLAASIGAAIAIGLFTDPRPQSDAPVLDNPSKRAPHDAATDSGVPR